MKKEDLIDKIMWFMNSKLKEFIQPLGTDSYMFRDSQFERYLNETIPDFEINDVELQKTLKK